MYGINEVVILSVVVLVACVYVGQAYVKEGFMVPQCPDRAVRTSEGMIQAGDRTFKSLEAYTSYLRDLYAQGARCMPPKVEDGTLANKSGTILPGILGGLGNGAEPPEASNRQGSTREVLNMPGQEMTSATTPIKKLDDYEYTRVFKTESPLRTGLTPETKNDMLSKYVLDWAKLPFNSEDRAAKEDEFVAGRMEGGFRDPASGVFFNNISNPHIVNPAEEAARLREQAILAQYQPTDVSTHIIDSDTAAVAKLVNDVYATDPNWEPVVARTDENKWEVRELRPKARKELWEDAQTLSLAGTEGSKQAAARPDDTGRELRSKTYKEQLEDAGTVSLATADGSQQVIAAPSLRISDRLADDPYFDKAGVTDTSNDRFWKYSDFNKWTPGLERMFAPTFSQEQWS
jgi:hypothetical protein